MKKLSTVSAAIIAAIATNDTVYESVRGAAAQAATQLPKSGTVAERHKAVMDLYKDDFKNDKYNVRGIFSSFLIIHANSKLQVTVPVIVQGETVQKTMPASEALGMAKHAMQKAAAQVREKAGIGKKGSGRKASKVQSTENNEDLAFAAWIHNLQVYLIDGRQIKQIAETAKKAGYTIKRIPKK